MGARLGSDNPAFLDGTPQYLECCNFLEHTKRRQLYISIYFELSALCELIATT
jgi:hypothetical protein